MSTSNTAKAAPGQAAPVAAHAAVQEALEVTWTLKGHLKNAQIAYIRVGLLLAEFVIGLPRRSLAGRRVSAQ